MGLLVGNLLFPLLVHPQLRSPCSSELRNGATHTWMRVNAGVLKLCLSPQGACCVAREQAGTETDRLVQGTPQ